MEQKVTRFLEHHKLDLFGKKIVVGVSGGPDSIALLHYLWKMRKKWDLQLTALSVDHQLRGDESKEDLAFVKDICQKWNISFKGVSLNVPTYKETHQLNTQVACRNMRYQFFYQQMKELSADFLALGHHGDDQVETMVMRLIRTADSSVFQGIPIKREFADGHIIRPFLCVTKKEIEQYCAVNMLNPRRDPSNESIAYTRNYIRKKIVPLLRAKNENIHTTVQYLTESLHEDERYLQQEAKLMVQQVVNFSSNKDIASFYINDFSSYPTALQRRAYHLILNYLYFHLPKNLSYVHEQDFFELLNSTMGNVEIDFPRHLKLKRSYQKVMFYFTNKHHVSSPYHFILDIPEKVSLPNGSQISAVHTDKREREDRFTYICALDDVELPLHIRTRQPGDRMSWKGLNGSKKIKDIFIDAKIPKDERDAWPIVTDNHGQILWLVGLKKGFSEAKGTSDMYIQLNYKNARLWEGQFGGSRY